MIKVVIADDEVRICQLIQALIDWEELGLEVAGVAHNGLEAVELVRTVQPDILITDIRMPGCSGLELIGRVKEQMPKLEIIVISGYAHFEYAQQAIRYGVGDYLLKPVSKTELTATLEKLKAHICERRETVLGKEELLRKAEKDVSLLRTGLIHALVEQENTGCSAEALRETYHLQIRPGIFQAFCVRMDCGREEFGEGSTAVLMEKVREVLELGLREKCTELLLGVSGLCCAGFFNYRKDAQEDIRRALKLCMNQLELQKSLFRPVNFSVALGSAEREPERLGESMREARLLSEERLIRGTGRLYERLGASSGQERSMVLEHYLRAMTSAVEVHSAELLGSAVDTLSRELLSVREIRGYELLETVYSAAEVFAVKMQMPEKAEYMEKLREQCSRCSSAAEVFGCLRDTQCGYLARLSEQQENEAIRPVRRAKQYIQEHYSEPITQEEVSSRVGLTPAYFSALFKKTEGEGFAKYLIRVRMDQAKILLRESNLPVAEICRRVGYNDVKHFTHTFEKAAGVKPAVYRKLYG